MNLKNLWYKLIGVYEIREKYHEVNVKVEAMRRIIVRNTKLGADIKVHGNTTVAIISTLGDGYVHIFDVHYKNLADLVHQIQLIKQQHGITEHSEEVYDLPTFSRSVFYELLTETAEYFNLNKDMYNKFKDDEHFKLKEKARKDIDQLSNTHFIFVNDIYGKFEDDKNERNSDNI